MPRLVIGTVALLLALAACGGDPKADPSPTPSTPVSTAPSPTASAPVMPAEASANTKAGAIAFVRYYVELINYAQATGDVDPLKAIEGEACESCTNVRESIRRTYGNGGSIEGGAWRPNLTIALHNEDDSWLVSGFIRFDPERVRESATSSFVPGPGGSAMAHVTVLLSGSGWKVLAWSRES